MYQEFFHLKAMPFDLTPSTHCFCQPDGILAAHNTLEYCIKNGGDFIKIIGKAGSSKMLLCRKLLDSLNEQYVTAYIPNSNLPTPEIRKTIARELGLNPIKWEDQYEFITHIHQHLIQLHADGKKVILLIDEAQALSDDSLETIRLLTNFATESTRLLQVILFAQPELDARLNQPQFRQIKKRISFSYYLPLMTSCDFNIYLHHRLLTADYTHNRDFTKSVKNMLYSILSIVNILSHKTLLSAYSKDKCEVTQKSMQLTIKDTEVTNVMKTKRMMIISSIVMLISLAAYISYYTAGSLHA